MIPDTELAEAAGLEVADGIVVDEYGRVPGHENVFAAGDVARFPVRALGTTMRIEHEDHANWHGKAVGANMAGANAPYDHLPFFYSDLSTSATRRSGMVDSRLEVVEDWQEPNRKGVVTYVEDGKPRGVLLWNVWDKLDDARDADPRRRGRPCRLAPSPGRASRGAGPSSCASRCSGRSRTRSSSCSRACACRRPLVAALRELAGITAAVELGRGSLLAAALLVQLKTLLDNADGQLARLTGRTSAFGRYLDSEVDLSSTQRSSPRSGGRRTACAGARRLPRPHERPQPQLQRRAAVARGVGRAGAPEGGATAVLRRIYGLVYAPQTGSPRGSSRDGPALTSSRAVSLLANLGMSTQLAAFGLLMAFGHPLVFAWLALAEVAVIALALLPRRAPSKQEEVA